MPSPQRTIEMKLKSVENTFSKLNLESKIRVLGPQRNMPVQASRRFETFRFLKRKVARPSRSKNANSVTLSQPQISECCELRFRKPEPTEVSCHAARMYLVRRVRRRRSAWSYLTSREARLDREVDQKIAEMHAFLNIAAQLRIYSQYHGGWMVLSAFT